MKGTVGKFKDEASITKLAKKIPYAGTIFSLTTNGAEFLVMIIKINLGSKNLADFQQGLEWMLELER